MRSPSQVESQLTIDIGRDSGATVGVNVDARAVKKLSAPTLVVDT